MKLRSIQLSKFYNLVMAAAFLLTLLLVVFLGLHELRKQALEEAETTATRVMRRYLAVHTYFNQNLKPYLFDQMAPVLSEEDYQPIWMSSSYALRVIDDTFQEMDANGYRYKDAVINARNPLNEADVYERQFILDINQDPTLERRSEIRTIDGKRYLHVVMRGEMVAADCMRCHGTPEAAPQELVTIFGAERGFNRQVGEIISAVSVIVPLEEAYASGNRIAAHMAAILLVTMTVLFGLQYALNHKLLFEPLARISSKRRFFYQEPTSRPIADLAPVGKEFNDLISSLTRLSGQTRQDERELDERVRQKTAHLERVNKQLVEDISTTQAEADTLLREVYHRIKNHLQVVISLLALQSQYVADPKAVEALMKGQERVFTMQLLHQQMYQTSTDLTGLNARGYIETLVYSITQMFGMPSSIVLRMEIEDTEIPMDTAFRCGLIINELVTNSIKHAFPDGRSGTIRLAFTVADGEFRLDFSDDGVGLPESIDQTYNDSLGLQLIALLTKQLQGKLEHIAVQGTAYSFRFPAKAQNMGGELK